ncbi:hypothetical protein OAE73_00190 [bacterium]|nr:hypothetical protein [bacterium]
MYWFKRKRRQIKRVISFLPIIWKGFDWDYRYAVEIFQHQLKRTADLIEKDGRHLNNENTANRIRTAVDLLERVYDEKYSLEYLDQVEKKYGKSNFDFVETGDFDKNGDPYYTMEESYENNYTKGELELISEDKSARRLESFAKQKRAHKLVWEFIEHNIQNWWD